ncbi:hypothetical protein AAFF_G00058160 [Aldrovandia affinis]|uniref:Uncharacterized protein n=1 Tax=Aldrovandia affinis TaxID=143900 RepID=A0AAD7WE23_9TELE|nr:hypothetical protein AAFF_G00058160 [Aldrovandia affinis]
MLHFTVWTQWVTGAQESLNVEVIGHRQTRNILDQQPVNDYLCGAYQIIRFGGSTRRGCVFVRRAITKAPVTNGGDLVARVIGVWSRGDTKGKPGILDLSKEL